MHVPRRSLRRKLALTPPRAGPSRRRRPYKRSSGRMARQSLDRDLKLLGHPEDEAQRTFVFKDEDHTLGNSLRHVLMQDARTDFCGYSMPHPSEPVVHVRLQTTGEPAVTVMNDGLKNLADICDTLAAKLNAQGATADWPRRAGGGDDES
mmetsp:Transcript_21504/g.69218  ORF Transcript_21504/g.69218 Transcript_21504/m.69218 type:complete len:150 (+) Transcript_21504:82-531(+)